MSNPDERDTFLSQIIFLQKKNKKTISKVLMTAETEGFQAEDLGRGGG